MLTPLTFDPSRPFHSSLRTNRTPEFASSGNMTLFRSSYCCWTTFSIRCRRTSKTCWAGNCSGPCATAPSSRRCLSAATRISKNSSRFVQVIQRKRRRSSSGVSGSCASASTRLLNSSMLSSRLMYRSAGGSVGASKTVSVFLFQYSNARPGRVCQNIMRGRVTRPLTNGGVPRAIRARRCRLAGLAGGRPLRRAGCPGVRRGVPGRATRMRWPLPSRAAALDRRSLRPSYRAEVP